MVAGFFLVNFLNLATYRFGLTQTKGGHVSGAGASPPLDPFKVAGSGLDHILEQAKSTGVSTLVTVLMPIKYELEYPSIHYAGPSIVESESTFSANISNHIVDGVLKSLEDPFLSKWIVLALVMSVVLNGYLFNAARLTIKEPHKALDSIPCPFHVCPYPSYNSRSRRPGRSRWHEAPDCTPSSLRSCTIKPPGRCTRWP